MTTAIAERLATRIFASPNLTEPGRVYRQAAGSRNTHGEWVSGGFTRVDTQLATAPAGGPGLGSGITRLIEEAGLREVDTRWFCVKVDADALTDVSEGDAIWHDGRLYRAEIVREWGSFREVVAVFPFSGDLTVVPPPVTVTGAFSAAFGPAFDTVYRAPN